MLKHLGTGLTAMGLTFGLLQLTAGTPEPAYAVVNTFRNSAILCEFYSGSATRSGATWQDTSTTTSGTIMCPIIYNDQNLPNADISDVSADVYIGTSSTSASAKICYFFSSLSGCGSPTSTSGTGNKILSIADLTPMTGGLSYYNFYILATIPVTDGGLGHTSLFRGYGVEATY